MFTTKLKVKKAGKSKKDYILEAPLKYDYNGTELIVPINAMTDFASTPKWLHWLFKPQSKGYSKSSVLHDDLYYSKTFSKFKSDWIFLDAMKSEQMELINRNTEQLSNKIKDLEDKLALDIPIDKKLLADYKKQLNSIWIAKTKWLAIRWSFYLGVTIGGWLRWL